MPQVARIGDLDSNYLPPDISVEGSSTVFVNGLGVHRLGDEDSANESLAEGSSTVFIEGMECGRLGDSDTNGDLMITASLNVFAG